MAKIQSSNVRERILDVARELFVAKGYAATSIRDIATASDANVAHVKYYFGSKADLFEIIFDEAFEILENRVFSALNSDMPFEEMIENWINAYYELLPEYPQIPMFILNEISHSPEALVKKILKKNPQRIFSRFSDRMEDEIRKGTVRPVPVLDFGLNVLSLCVFPFMFRGLVLRIANMSNNDYNALLKEHKQYVIDFVLRALQP